MNNTLENEITGFVKAASRLLEVNEALERNVSSLRNQVYALQRELHLTKTAAGYGESIDTETVVEVLRDLQLRKALPDNSDRTVAKLASAIGRDPVKLVRIMKSAVASVLPAPAKGPGAPLGYNFPSSNTSSLPSLEDYLEEPAPGREHEVPRRR